MTAVPHAGEGQVTVRAKPERRKNAKERAKERARAKGKLGAADEAAVTPEVTSPETAGLSTAHPKPEKRKNAKERAKKRSTHQGSDHAGYDGKGDIQGGEEEDQSQSEQGGRQSCVGWPPKFQRRVSRIAPVGTRLRKAAATEDGGDGVFGSFW